MSFRFIALLSATAAPITALLAISALTPTAAEACSCALREREPSFAEAASVFEGQVTALDAPADGGPIRVTFEVARKWKGAEAETLVLSTAAHGAACGYSFESGQSYLVYSHQADDGTEWVGLCSRTRPTSDEQAAADIEAMGAGVTPVDPTGGTEEPPPAPAEVPPIEQRSNNGGCASCAVTGGGDGLAPILAGVVLLGFAFRRFNR